jgi:hypothetical protein
VARAVLGIMLGMAVLGLTFALFTKEFRRGHDEPQSGPGESVPLTGGTARATPPAELAGLGYLPSETTVVAGLHLAELLQEEEGQKLWQKLREGRAGAALRFVQDKTGLKAEEIDHLVLGDHPSNGVPRLVVVVRTRRPYDPQVLAKALAPARPQQEQGRTVYRFPLGFIGDGVVIQAGAETLVLSLGVLPAEPRDFQAIPTTPRAGAAGLPQTIREMLTTRLDRTSLLWAVGGAPGELPGAADVVKLFSGSSPDVLDFLLNLKAFSAGLRLQGGLTLGAALQGKDEKAARELAALLEKLRPDGVESYTVVGPPGAAAPPDQRAWVQIQIRANPAVVVDLMDRRLAALVPGGG